MHVHLNFLCDETNIISSRYIPGQTTERNLALHGIRAPFYLILGPFTLDRQCQKSRPLNVDAWITSS